MLVVLQALDAAGKDGTIRHVMSGVNPQGVQVHSFKVPSSEELDHDYLWRYARRLPARGEIGIFNRSHYEEVLVVRVHPENLERQKLPERCEAGGRMSSGAIEEINDWERYLTENGFRIVKLFLNLSNEEQRTRFLRRIDLPDHNWKFSAADVRERERWDDYQKAFSEMLSHTSTEWAPWYVIPADRKWFGRIAAGAVLVHTLMEIDPQFPVVTQERHQALLEIKETLEAQAPKGAAPDPFAAGELRSATDDAVLRAAQPAALWYSLEPEAIAARLGVDPAVGLSSQRARSCWRRTVPNALPAEQAVPAWKRFVGQYRSYMQLILVGAAIVSLAIKEWSTGVLLIVITWSTRSLACARRARRRAR